MKGKSLRVRIANPISIEKGRVRPLGLLLVALALGLTAAFTMLAYDFGRQLLAAEGDKAREQISLLRKEVERLNGVLAAAESLRNIERATQEKLTEQVKSLEGENIRLKEELSFYERLVPAKPGKSNVAIRRFTAEAAPPNHLRYRLLVLSGEGKDKQGFNGQAQLVVTAMQDNRQINIVFPQPQSPEEQNFKLRFRHYQRLEGILNLPDGVTVRSIQAHILENDQIRVQQTIKL